MIEIRRLTDLGDLDPLLAASEAEGFRFVRRLVADWSSGRERFDKDGEALFGAYRGKDIVGIGGLTLDPYQNESRVGRVRRLYVHPQARRNGAGRMLVESIIEKAATHFDELTLFTDHREAAAFYERLGFRPESAEKVSHRLALSSRCPDLA